MSGPEFVEEYRYEQKLNEARQFFQPDTGPLISVKVRPVESASERWDVRYIYTDEYYEAIERALSLFPKVQEGYVSRGRATAYDIGDGERLVFVEHETGPEFIFAPEILGVIRDGAIAATATAVAVNQWARAIQTIRRLIERRPHSRKSGGRSTMSRVKRPADRVVDKVNETIDIIRKEHAKNRGKGSKRYYGAKAISIEKRTAFGGKIIKQVNVADDAVSKFIDDLDLQ